MKKCTQEWLTEATMQELARHMALAKAQGNWKLVRRIAGEQISRGLPTFIAQEVAFK